jgi:uncharacterized protein YutE (UPF0331/DUF86 family)
MYYVNVDQIHQRLQFIPLIAEVCGRLQENGRLDSTGYFAQERALQLAIEVVTDVGSCMIDGFLMRDASSYEDIVEILRGENVLSAELARYLSDLVKLRKPLMQEYSSFPRDGLHSSMDALAGRMDQFNESITRYLQEELKQGEADK